MNVTSDPSRVMTSNVNLCLPEGYVSRSQVQYFHDIHNERIWQPSIYAMASYFQDRAQVPYIIDIGCGTANGARHFIKKGKYIGIDFGNNLKVAQVNMPNGTFYEHDLETPLSLPEEILQQAIVICADVVEHVLDPTILLNSIAHMAKFAPFVLISTPDRERCRGIDDMGPPANTAHVREWTCGEFTRLLHQCKFDRPVMGYTLNNNIDRHKSTIVALTGTHTAPVAAPAKRTLAIITCYNDEDIIIETTKHLVEQGVYIWFMDNWSTDVTWTLLEGLKQAYPDHIVALERFPAEGPSQSFSWTEALKRKQEISFKADFDWFFHYDSDELRYSPWAGVTLAEAINYVDALGYNAIDHTVLNFRPTRDGFNAYQDPTTYFSHFEFAVNSSDHCQIKGWAKCNNAFDIVASGGHDARFENRKVFPLNFLNRHFSLRSSQQAHTKVYAERGPRTAKEKSEKGWHQHYDRYLKFNAHPHNFIWPPQALVNFSPTQFPHEYLVERLTNIDSPCSWKTS